MNDTVAAIRLRTRHHDPYEEWARRTRRDALVCTIRELRLSPLTYPSTQKTARRAVVSAQSQRASAQAAAHKLNVEKQAMALRQDADLVADRLAEFSLRQAEDVEQLGFQWSDEQKRRRARTEQIIRTEEAKLRALQAEAERLRKEAEAKAAAEEQRKKEEAAKAAKEAEEAKAKTEKEEAARKEAELVERAKAQALEAQAKERNVLGMSTPDQDWREARLVLKVRFLPALDRDHLLTKMPMQQLKSGPIARVKADRDLKKLSNEVRRKITPRVGQLTNEPQVIANIVSQQWPAWYQSKF